MLLYAQFSEPVVARPFRGGRHFLQPAAANRSISVITKLAYLE